jgi:uncharacterized membrane protein
MKPISKPLFLGMIGAGLGLANILVIAGSLKTQSDPEGALALMGIGYIPMILGAVFMFVLIHRMWSSLQDDHARTTPGKAVGFLFIPFYNFYWAFQVFPGFATDYNNHIDRRGLAAPRMPGGLFVTYVIFCFLAIIPVLGLVIVVVNFFIGLVMVSKICDGINALAAASAPAAVEA